MKSVNFGTTFYLHKRKIHVWVADSREGIGSIDPLPWFPKIRVSNPRGMEMDVPFPSAPRRMSRLMGGKIDTLEGTARVSMKET